MFIVCLDLEGVLTPEIWIEFSKKSGIPELSRTTRDEPDYDKLMRWRLDILGIDPLPGAKEFLDELRSFTQTVILSDTFTQFAAPLMKKLGWPTILCNELIVAPDGTITDYHMRCENTKLSSVKAFRSIGYDTIAAGDSYNDLDMIRAGRGGVLFRSTDAIRAANPDIPSCEEYDELLRLFRGFMR